jgi:hypothetical protein
MCPTPSPNLPLPVHLWVPCGQGCVRRRGDGEKEMRSTAVIGTQRVPEGRLNATACRGKLGHLMDSVRRHRWTQVQ